MQRIIFSIFAAIFILISCYSQPLCQVKTFNLRDGLASNVVTRIVQTDDQLMWFATWSGLTSYNGYRFTNYHEVPDKQRRVLTTNRLMELTPNSTGNIWCTTYDQRPYLFDRTQGRYIDIMAFIKEHHGVSFTCNGIISIRNGHTWLLSVNEGYVARIDDNNYHNKEGIQLFKEGEGILQGKSFNWIYEDSDIDEWIVTHEGIINLKSGWKSEEPYLFITNIGKRIFMASKDGRIGVYDKTTDKHSTIPTPNEIKEIGSLQRINEEEFAATTNKGIFIYNDRTKQSHLIELPEDAQVVKNRRTLYCDKHRNLWIMYGEGTHLLKIKESTTIGTFITELYSIHDRIPKLKQSNQNLFHEDQEGILWVATSNGFFGYYDPSQNTMQPYPLRTQETQPYIERWMIDRQGNLWFSNNHNLALIQFKQHNIHHQTDASEVRSVLFDSQGRLWTGFRSGKITVDNQYLGGDGNLHKTPSSFTSHIYCLYEDSQKNIWIGSKGDGLYRLTPKGEFSHYIHNPNDPNSICSNQIYDVYEDHQGRIWIGTFEKGISLFSETRDGKPQFKNAGSQLTRYPLKDFHKVRRITETADSTIIVSASNGMVVFKDNDDPLEDIRFYAHKHVPDDSSSLLTSDVMQTFVASDSTIYVATVGGGLQCIDSKALKNPSKPLQLENISHLIHNCGIIYGLSEDRTGNIWIGCENSLNMYDTKQKKMWCYGAELLGEETRLAEALPTYNSKYDKMVMATSSGTIHFECNKLQKNSFVPPIVFGDIQFHGQEEDSYYNSHSFMGDSLTIPANRRNLTIHFAALDYQDNDMIRYAYRLNDTDEKWNYLEQERSISWSNLPHGHHKLQIRSTNAHGIWVDNTRTLNLFVQPTFWESWKGKGVQALGLMGVILLAVWIYRIRTRAEMQHKLDSMKLEFFSDISHKLRTPLTLISGPIAEVLNAGGLNDTSQAHLEMVKRNASRMLEMVNKMLTYTKGKHNYISDENVEEVTKKELHATIDEPQVRSEKPHLLVVEDNDDLRDFLACILESEYEVTQAVNGREGLDKARALHPDFILTDVMMPEMDGLSMVREIKDNTNTSHIPIVILSAKASMDDRIEGLKLGVNDYITKPFNATYLKQRMANIINNRRALQQSYLEQIKENASNKQIQSLQNLPQEEGYEDVPVIRLTATNIIDSDKEIMERLLAYIDENLDNPELKIEELASAVCLGRTVFYNKIRTLVGLSPVELLRQIRIQRAEDMVAKSNEPYSRIAYTVGFNDPRYFSKCFKAQTGLTPSEYRERSRTNPTKE